MEHGIRTTQAPPSPAHTAAEPLGDLVSGDALHTNPAAVHARGRVAVDVAAEVAASADARAVHPTTVTA
ncbi:hypothetical protein ACIQ6R_13225 [Streptomyces sp. NPDC096048]|uniref:hypothetical protein n=1 Tax=Streptomyces sp. NPDC096048 TaxID=3366072 RepID=UPI003827AF47